MAINISDTELLELAARLRPLLFQNWAPLSVNNTSNPPTDAELDTAFGTPATLSDGHQGFLASLDDNDGDANVYLLLTNGTSWWYVALTKAV